MEFTNSINSCNWFKKIYYVQRIINLNLLENLKIKIT